MPTQERLASRDDIRQLNLSVPAADLSALQLAKITDRIPATVRIRAMLRLWVTDKDFRRAVDALAAEGARA